MKKYFLRIPRIVEAFQIPATITEEFKISIIDFEKGTEGGFITFDMDDEGYYRTDKLRVSCYGKRGITGDWIVKITVNGLSHYDIIDEDDFTVDYEPLIDDGDKQ